MSSPSCGPTSQQSEGSQQAYHHQTPAGCDLRPEELVETPGKTTPSRSPVARAPKQATATAALPPGYGSLYSSYYASLSASYPPGACA